MLVLRRPQGNPDDIEKNDVSPYYLTSGHHALLLPSDVSHLSARVRLLRFSHPEEVTGLPASRKPRRPPGAPPPAGRGTPRAGAPCPASTPRRPRGASPRRRRAVSPRARGWHAPPASWW